MLTDEEQDLVKELKEAITNNSLYHMKAWLRIVTKKLGLGEARYKELIKSIRQDHKDFPDLDT